MTMIPASAAAQPAAPLPLDHATGTVASVHRVAGLPLLFLECGERIDAATLRGAMETAFGGRCRRGLDLEDRL